MLPEKPETNRERYYSAMVGQENLLPERPITREEQYLDEIVKKGLGTTVIANPEDVASESLRKIKVDEVVYSVPGGSGGDTSDYTELDNKPEINGVTLAGNKTGSDLGLVDAEEGKGLSENDYTDADKAIVDGVTNALADKVDKVEGKGLSTNDYTDADATIVAGVTTALGGKQDTLVIDENGYINL